MYFTALPIVYLYLLQRSSIIVKAHVDDWRHTAIRYVDYDDDYNDAHLDRLVGFVVDIPNYAGYGGEEKKSTVALGILISDYRVLSSYNPFRRIARDNSLVSKTYAIVFKGRTRYPDNRVNYTLNAYKLTCGRQVVYFPDEDIPDSQWHGPDQRNSPVHDLIVMRLFSKTVLSNYTTSTYLFKDLWPSGKTTTKKVDSFVTALANKSDSIGDSIKLASLGFRNNKEINRWHEIHVAYYTGKDKLIVKCEDWLPREWGHFICLRNKFNYPGLGSSSLLFSHNKVFGVGCFLYFRADESIMVFTDVRPYNDVIMKTCVESDMKQ